MNRASNPQKRRRAERRGRWAEWLVMFLLMLKGYQMAAHRLRTPMGELDLVMRKRDLLVFVEVKHRKGGAAAHSLSPQQSHRLVRAASWYLARLAGDYSETRFDLVLTGGWQWPQHLQNVLQADANALRAAP